MSKQTTAPKSILKKANFYQTPPGSPVGTPTENALKGSSTNDPKKEQQASTTTNQPTQQPEQTKGPASPQRLSKNSALSTSHTKLTRIDSVDPKSLTSNATSDSAPSGMFPSRIYTCTVH